MQFQNYKIIRNDRPNSTQGGGTTILYKNSLKASVLNVNELNKFELIETTIIKLKLINNNILIIVSLYANNSTRNKFIDELNILCKTLKINNKKVYFLIAGDFNARHKSWGDNTANQRGRYLYRWNQNNGTENNCSLYNPSTPTFDNSFLDHCLADSRLEIETINSKIPVVYYESDHHAVKLTVQIPSHDETELEPEQQKKFLYKKTNWRKFAVVAHNNFTTIIPSNKNLSNIEIDSYLRDINKTLLDTIESTVPVQKSLITSTRFVNSRVEKLHNDKSYLLTQLLKLKRGQINATNDTAESIKLLIKDINKNIEYELQKQKSDY